MNHFYNFSKISKISTISKISISAILMIALNANNNANAATISVAGGYTDRIAGENIVININKDNDQDDSSVTLAIRDNSCNGTLLTEQISAKAGSQQIFTPSKISEAAVLCVDSSLRGNAFNIRPAAFEFKLKESIDGKYYGNTNFANNNLDNDPFAGQKVFLEVIPYDASTTRKQIENTCDKQNLLTLKLSGTLTQSNGKESFTADNSKFIFTQNNGQSQTCVGNKLYFPFRFLDFGLLTINENSFASDFHSGKIQNISTQLGIFKAAYVYFEGELKEIQSSPQVLNYMGQPFDTRLVYTAYPQTESGNIDNTQKLVSYTYNENAKNYMFDVGLTKSYDNDGDYDIKEKIAGYDISKSDIYAKLLKDNQWKNGEIVFDSLNNAITPSEETKKYRLRYIRPNQPKEPQTVSVFGSVIGDNPKQASQPQIATKGDANGVSVVFGRLHFADIMHYDKENLKVKVIPQMWQNSTWVNANDSHTKNILNDAKFFKLYDKNNTLFALENADKALEVGFLKISTTSGNKKVETYVCANLGVLAENQNGNDNICATATSAEIPWLKGIWINTGKNYNQNPYAHVFYGLNYSDEKSKTVYTRELW